MFVRFARSALVLVVLAICATACASGGPSDTGSDPTVEPSTGAPKAEATGDEPPAPGDPDKPAIETAGAPAGGGPMDRDEGEPLCMDVRWSGGRDDANLGEGVEFKVTNVELTGATPGNWTCPDDPCPGFTFDNNGDNCSFPVRAGPAEGTLALRGNILCSARPEVCQRFRANLKLRTIPVPAAEASHGPTPSKSAAPSRSAAPSKSAGPSGGPTSTQSEGPDEPPSPAE
jgi:hypothetical protein